MLEGVVLCSRVVVELAVVRRRRATLQQNKILHVGGYRVLMNLDKLRAHVLLRGSPFLWGRAVRSTRPYVLLRGPPFP